jgi:hypothetical protein
LKEWSWSKDPSISAEETLDETAKKEEIHDHPPK